MAAQKITTPFPTPERTAEILGVSKSRANRLIRWAREVSQSHETGTIGQGSENGQTAYRKTTRKAG